MENLKVMDGARHCSALVPVFNDWGSVKELIADLDVEFQKNNLIGNVYIVNDGSTVECPFSNETFSLKFISEVFILNLTQNVGHQRALAAGLAYLARMDINSIVVVMDGDGEDMPSVVPQIVTKANKSRDAFIVVRRVRRNEGMTYKFFYWCYKLGFRILTGERLQFGNFCGFHSRNLHALTGDPDIPLHLASRICRLRASKIFIESPKGLRYDGESKMNFYSLVSHALAAFAVFSDLITARLFVFWALLSVFALLGIVTVVSIKLFSAYAIPGWATFAVGLLANLIVLALTLCINSALLILSVKSNVRVTANQICDAYMDAERVLIGCRKHIQI